MKIVIFKFMVSLILTPLTERLFGVGFGEDSSREEINSRLISIKMAALILIVVISTYTKKLREDNLNF